MNNIKIVSGVLNVKCDSCLQLVNRGECELTAYPFKKFDLDVAGSRMKHCVKNMSLNADLSA